MALTPTLKMAYASMYCISQLIAAAEYGTTKEKKKKKMLPLTIGPKAHAASSTLMRFLANWIEND